MGKLFIPRKEFLLSSEELDRALRTDFLTIERWAKDSSTRIILPDGGDPLSGDVSVIPGNNVGLLRDGNGFLIYANPPGARRALSVFAPGAASARTLQKATIPDPVLQQLDVFILTPATGADVSNHSNVIVEGTGSGSVTLPITSGLQEWHLGPADIGVPLGSLRTTTPDNWSSPATAFAFTPSADLTIFNLDAMFSSKPWGRDRSCDPPFVRIGIATGIAASSVPTLADPSGGAGGGWVTGLDGITPCWVDVDADTISNGVRAQWTLPGAAGFKLLQATTYWFVTLHKNTEPTAPGLVHTNHDFPAGSGRTVQGNITTPGSPWAVVNSGNTLGGAWDTASFTSWAAADFSLLGSIVGVMFTGLVQVRQSITGAPTTPGSDMEIYVQC